MDGKAGGDLAEMASRIKEMREIIGFSTAQMAEKTGVSVSEYEQVEAGKVDPTFNFLHHAFILTTRHSFNIDFCHDSTIFSLWSREAPSLTYSDSLLPPHITLSVA